MEFQVLGPITVTEAGVPVDISSLTVLELLAVLLVSPANRASHDTIANFLWPGEEANGNRIRQFYHQLREHIPGIASQRNSRGYCQIHVDPQMVDYGRFQSFRRAADAADDPSIRLKAFRSALDEVRGTPLEDLPGKGFEHKRSALVGELRDVTVACVLAELECGQASAALERVEAVLATWPMTEELLELNVRALSDLGRYDEVEPLLTSCRLRSGLSIDHVLLRGTRRSSTFPPAGRMDAPTHAQPRQLPSSAVDMVGRELQLQQSADVLMGRTAGRGRLAVVSGMPGVGKTLLAVRTAARIETSFPDATLYVDLGGFSPGEPVGVGAVLARFLNDLGVTPATPTLDGMATAYRTALADRAVLLILDNARDEDHVRPLLPGPGASAAIVTSRRQLHGLAIKEGAELIDLAPLDRHDATELLRVRLGENRMGKADPFIGDLIEHCAGVPLALGIMAARIAQRPHALAAIVRDLCQTNTRLHSLDLGSENLSVRLMLETSHKQLSAQAARFFWQLAVHPGPTVSWAALQALAPENGVAVTNAMDELMRMSLVTEPVPERCALHDLVRVYAAELADQQDEHERAQVVERVLRFLLHNAWVCDRKLDPDRRLPIGEASGIKVVTPACVADAMGWFEDEYSTLTAAVALAVERGLDRYTWLLSMVLVTFQWRSGRHLDTLKHLTGALEAAARVAGPADVAMVHRMLAGTHRGLGDLPRATGELRRAVRVSHDHGDILGVALGRHALGVLLRESGFPDEALEHFAAALSAFEKLGDNLGRGGALNGMGSARFALGQYDEGLELCLQSLALLDGTDDLNGVAHVLFSLGRIRLALDDHQGAVADFERAHGVYWSLAYTSRRARALVWLADALRGAGLTLEAEAAIEQARALLRDMGESHLDAAIERIRCLP